MGHALHVIRAIPASPERPGGRLALDDVECPAVRAGVGYWKRLRGARKFPSRDEIAPRDIRGLLRNTVLLRVVDGGSDYQYRIVGDAHVVAHGFSAQGRSLSEMDMFAAGYGPVIKALYDYPVRTGKPLALRGWMSKGLDDEVFVYSESVFLPLGPDEATVDHVLNFSVYIPHPGQTILPANA